jgi:hypothetical protein
VFALRKIVTLEVVIRGDIIEKNIILNLGRFLSESKLRLILERAIVPKKSKFGK